MADILDSQIRNAQVPGVNVSSPGLITPVAPGIDVDPNAEYGIKKLAMLEQVKAAQRGTITTSAFDKAKQAEQKTLDMQNVIQSLISKYN